MSSIDKRIVQMQFDNQNFESGVSKTMATLQKLNEKLKMKDSTKGLEEMNKGLNGLSSTGLSGLSSGVATVTSKFSALGVIAATALANITNSAVNAGKALVKSFTLDPILDGFSEYELKMNSIQTILTNTQQHGTSLDDVNKALAELNTYSDKTIYNFAQMTDNIGKATAAGLTLEQAVTFVKGMSNAAAGFGVDSTRMAGATYQMTQALAAGVVKLQDWRSLEQAGMGGAMIQEEMYKAAESMGVFVDKSIPFRDSLESGWLSAEIFTKAMDNMANSEALTKAASDVTSFTKLMDTLKETVGSGWAQSFEHIFGDKEESTALWTGISDSLGSVINKSAEARNKVLQDWKELGGRNDVIEGFTNVAQSLGKGLKAIGDAWKEVFPAMTGERLADLSRKFKDFTENIKMSDETAGKIKDTFKGVFSVFKTVGSAIGNVVKAFSPLLGVFKPIGSGLLTVTSELGKFVTKISDAASKSQIFTKIADGIKSAFSSLGDILGNAAKSIGNFFKNLNFGDVSSTFTKLFSGIGEAIAPIGEGIGKALSGINFDTLSNLAKSLVGLGVFKTLKNVLDEFKGVGEGLSGVFESFSGIGESVKGVLDSTREALSSWQNSLNAGTLIKLASAIGILAASLTVLSTIEPTKLATALAGMAGLFAELSLAMLAINKIGNIKGLMKTSTGMILMSTAILVLSGAMKNLSGMNLGEIVSGLAAMAAMLGLMAIAVKTFSTASSGLIKTSAGLIVFGAAMQVMASALEKLGEIDTETLGAGLFALGGVLTELALFLAAAKFGSLGVADSVGILVLSASLLVLQQAVEQFGSLNVDEIIRGLVGIAGVLTEIAVFSKLSGSGLGMVATAAGLAAMSAAMMVMSAAMQSLAQIQWAELARGLTAMAGGLTVIGVASMLLNGAQMLLSAVGITAMSAALLVLSAAMQSMAGMSWDEIARGFTVLAGSLTVLAVAMYAMTGCIAGAAAMLVMAGALAVFTPQMIALGQLDLSQIGTALIALAGAFTVLGVAGLVLTPLAPGILAVSAAIALLGAGCLAAGTGVLALGTGLGVAAAAVSASGTVLINFAKELIALLPEIGLKAGEAMVNFASAVATGAPTIINAFAQIVTGILTTIGELIPKIAETAVKMITEFAKSLANGVPQLVESGVKMATGVFDGIAKNIGKFVESGTDLVVNFLNGISANIGRIIEAGINLALSFVEGVANGISSNTGRLESAVRSIIEAMAQAGLAVIRGSISGFTSGGKQLLEGLCNGIKSMSSSASSAVKNCINSAKKAASNLGSALVSAGKSLIQGLVKGITSMASSVASKARSVVQGAINAAKSALKINSPSKVFIEIGKYTSEGFAVGLDRYANRASSSATNLAKSVIDTVKNPLANVAKILNDDIDVNPVITPVLDLSNVKQNSKRLGDLLPDSGKLSLSTGRATMISASVGQIQNGTDNSDIISALKDLKDSMADSRPSYTVNGITYDDGSNIASAIETLARAAKIERRI